MLLERRWALELPGWRHDLWQETVDRTLAEQSEERGEVVFPASTHVLGGQPFWVQGPDRPQRSFFLQLAPMDALMIGDGGHLYLFLDPQNPQAGFDVMLQMD